jgi:TRAP-type mannitol/chloroaromatic compound transport system permease small subunit
MLKSLLTVAGLCLLSMAGIVTFSMLGREFFLLPIPDDLLLVGLLMVGVIALTVATQWCPPRWRLACDIFGKTLMLLFFGGISSAVALSLPYEFTSGAYLDGELEIPTWPAKTVFCVGFVAFSVELVLSIGRQIKGAMRHATRE